MSDRREEILSTKHLLKIHSSNTRISVDVDSIKSAMDEYMKECCLELLEYMAKNDVKCTWYDHEVLGRKYVFSYKGEDLTKEQLFENFL